MYKIKCRDFSSQFSCQYHFKNKRQYQSLTGESKADVDWERISSFSYTLVFVMRGSLYSENNKVQQKFPSI